MMVTQNENMVSVKAFCSRFGVQVTHWEMGTYGNASIIDTDAKNSHFRGLTLAQARVLTDGPNAGYCPHAVFIKEFERSGDALSAFKDAIHASVFSIVADMESQESDEYLADHCDAN